MFMRRRASVLGTVMAAVAVPAAAAAQQSVRLPARDAQLAERPANVFAVGAEEGRDWEMFSGVRAVAFDRSDNLYVLDAQNSRVVVFDAGGRYLRQFGKRGGGPGEFQAPLGMTVTPEGNVVVSDLANRGFVVFRPTGEHVRNVTFAEELGMPMGRIEADPRGGILTRANSMLRPGQAAAAAAAEEHTSFMRQPLQQGAAPATLFRAAVPAPKVTQQGERVMVMRMDPMFGARPAFGALPDGGLAVHHETEYAVKIVDANGRHVRTLTRAIQPRKVTKQDQERELERRRAAQASGAGAGTMISVTERAGSAANVQVGGSPRGPLPAGAIRPEDAPVAEYMAVVTGIRTDPQGRVWVQRRHADGSERGPIDIVAAAGKYIGTLPPQQLPDAVSASGLAAYIVRDDLGVERVVVRRLPQTWR